MAPSKPAISATPKVTTATRFEGVIAVQAVLCADSLALGLPYIMAA